MTGKHVVMSLSNMLLLLQAPICVVGLTCRLDVMELLEKRVKSRFSHRQIFVFPGSGQKDQSNFEARMALLTSLLLISEDDVTAEDAVFVHCWNSQVEDLCKEEAVQNVMRAMFNLDNSERTLRSFLVSDKCKAVQIFRSVCTRRPGRKNLNVNKPQEIS
jgi:hypothetical protein